jgi:hypothetical protein
MHKLIPHPHLWYVIKKHLRNSTSDSPSLVSFLISWFTLAI